MVQKLLPSAFALWVTSAASAGAATLFTTSTFDTGQEGWAGGASPQVISGDDPFLQIASMASSLATFNTSDPWSGDFTAAGITGLTLELRAPTSNPEPLAIRATLLGPGTGTRWVTEPVAVPADGIWRAASFSFDEASLTRITGTASLEETLAAVDRVLFRHDPGTPSQQGDPVTGSLDLDTIRIRLPLDFDYGKI